MDPVQLTIIVVSIVLTTVIVVLSVQVWYILSEFRLIIAEMRSSVTKANKILDDAGQVSGSVSGAVSGLSGVFGGVRTALSVLSAFRRKGESGND